MVVKGIEVAPIGMRQAQDPVAHYLADSELIVFISSPLYSGSCPPTAEAETAEGGTVTLSIDDSHDGVCTADANRDTFLIQGFTDTPTSLIVREKGRRTSSSTSQVARPHRCGGRASAAAQKQARSCRDPRDSAADSGSGPSVCFKAR